MEKYLHVTCMVKQHQLYDFLRALEVHKVGNVEVRPVAMTNGHAEPEEPREPTIKTTKSGRAIGTRGIVERAMVKDIPYHPSELHELTGVKRQSIQTALGYFVEQGIVKKVAPATYMKTKDSE